MGFLSTDELQKELGKCRVLLNTPKWNEAYGNVVVEALACGVPVIAYKRGGPSEIIQHGQTGYLADPDDKKNLLYYVEIIEKIKYVWGVIEDSSYASKIEQLFPQGTIDWMGFLSTDELQIGRAHV